MPWTGCFIHMEPERRPVAREREKDMDIYVGNLAYKLTDDELKSAFLPYGNVKYARIIMDRETGRSKGFGFVKMPERTQAKAAMEALNGTELAGRPLTINEARPRTRRSRQGGIGRYAGGFDGGYGGGYGGGGNRRY